MSLTRRSFTSAAVGLPLAASAGIRPISAADAGLEQIKFAVAGALSPIAAPFVLPEFLGYYKQEGLTVDVAALGTSTATAGAAHQGRIDAFVGVPSFQLASMANGGPHDTKFFFEYTYPFKWGVAVKPGSPLKEVKDFKGKKIGVHSFGTAEFPIAKSLAVAVGLDPEKDVSFLAVGEGAAAGYALNKGDIDGLVDNDVGFGAIESAGIKMDYLPLPAHIPRVGGLYIAALNTVLESKTKQMIGFARAVAKAQIFMVENPEAAAYAYISVFPEAAPRNKTLLEKIDAIAIPIRKRAKILYNYDTSVTDLGFMNADEMANEIDFAGLSSKLKPTDVTDLTTNQYIKEINKFDRQAIIADARNYKITGQ